MVPTRSEANNHSHACRCLASINSEQLAGVSKFKNIETMITKEITILGINYPVTFDLQTMLNFESTTGRSFFTTDFQHMSVTDRIHLIIAAVKSADENAKLNIEAIKGNCSYDNVKDIMDASNIIIILSAEFFPIHELEKKNNPEEPTEEGAKN